MDFSTTSRTSLLLTSNVSTRRKSTETSYCFPWASKMNFWWWRNGMVPRYRCFFQQHAWLGQYVCIKWCKKTILPFVNAQDLSKFVLLLENLKGQMHDNFKESVSSINGLLRNGLPDDIALWQPFDAGYAACLKSLIAIKHRKWLDIENNTKRWFGNEDPYTAKDRRILLT